MNLIGIQFDIAWENKAENFAKVRRLLDAAQPEKNSLVALPEMFSTGFTMNAEAMADSPGGEIEQFLGATAKEFQICLVAGAAMRGRDGRVRNKALVFSPAGELLAFYAKMRLFSPGGESNYYTPGEGPIAFQWNECAVSPFICYDIRFPEIFRAVAASRQPEVFVVIANWPEKRMHHWGPLLRARAIENQAYLLAVNRIGSDPLVRYTGGSMIIDPQGEVIAEAGDSERCIRATLDLARLRKYRQGLPFLADMRSPGYPG